MICLKEFHPIFEKALPSEQALAVINKMAPEPVEAADLYVSRARLANDAVDRSFEKFPIPVLERFAQTLPGKPVLIGHEMKSKAVGRWFGASLARDEAGVTHLIADFYVPAGSELARDIKLGVAKEVSIGYKAAPRTCDLCGEQFTEAHKAVHSPGSTYNGKVCTLTYSGEPSRYEALEGSFVGLACQYGAMAGVKADLPGAGIKMADEGIDFSVPMQSAEDAMTIAELEARIKALETENAELVAAKSLAEEGKLYRGDLLAGISHKLGVLEQPADLQVKLLAAADVAQLKEYDAELDARLNLKFPPSPQSKMLMDKEGGAALVPQLVAGQGAEGTPPAPGGGLRTSVFHLWDEE